MSRTTKLAFKFLRELNSSDVQDAFQSLDTLLEYLESKDDPDPVEVQMVDTAYQTLEKLKTLEGLLKIHIGEAHGITKGNKLQNLYDKAPTSIGSSILD
jgi:hypothetical protein